MMRTVGRAIAIALVLVSVACGSADSGVSKSAADRLQAEITVLRAASAAGNRKAAQAEVARLRAEIARLRATGELSTDAVHRIDAAVTLVERRLSLLPTPTTTTTTTSPPVTRGRGQSDDEHGKKRKEQD